MPPKNNHASPYRYILARCNFTLCSADSKARFAFRYFGIPFPVYRYTHRWKDYSLENALYVAPQGVFF